MPSQIPCSSTSYQSLSIVLLNGKIVFFMWVLGKEKLGDEMFVCATESQTKFCRVFLNPLNPTCHLSSKMLQCLTLFLKGSKERSGWQNTGGRSETTEDCHVNQHKLTQLFWNVTSVISVLVFFFVCFFCNLSVKTSSCALFETVAVLLTLKIQILRANPVHL